MKSGSIVTLILGIWLLCSPWALALHGAILGNNLIFGIIAAFVAWWSLATFVENHVPAWVNFCIGIWTFISAWVLGYSGSPTALWNAIIVGVLMAVFAATRIAAHMPTARPV